MDHLENLVKNTAKNILNPNEMLSKLIVGRIAKLGIELSPDQISDIKQRLQTEPLNKFNLELSDEQENKLKELGYDPNNLVLDLSDFDVEDLKENIENVFANMVPNVIETHSNSLLKHWEEQADTLLESQKKNGLILLSM